MRAVAGGAGNIVGTMFEERLDADGVQDDIEGRSGVAGCEVFMQRIVLGIVDGLFEILEEVVCRVMRMATAPIFHFSS